MLVIAPTTRFGIPMEHRIKIKLIGQTDAIVHVNRHLHFLLLQLILFLFFINVARGQTTEPFSTLIY
jgi:hypothetical protein